MKNVEKRPKYSRAASSILAGLKEIDDALASGEPLGKHFKMRRVEVVEPGKYDAAAVRATRRKIGVNQVVFSRLVGVSPDLAESWEQGRRTPDTMARRLLDEINRQPRHWARMIHETVAA